MAKIEELVVDRKEIKMMIEDNMTMLLSAINNQKSGDRTPTIGNTPQRPHKTSRATPSPHNQLEPMNIDHNIQAHGSHYNNPTASHAKHTNDGLDASAGANT